MIEANIWSDIENLNNFNFIFKGTYIFLSFFLYKIYFFLDQNYVQTDFPNDEKFSPPYTCSICISTQEPEILVYVSCCYNRFHKECIERWHFESITCPICRATHSLL